MPQSHKKEELRMKNKMKKWKVIGVLLVFLFGAAGFAYADVSIDSSNYTWEQNSYRPLRINYVTGTSYQILGFDAHLQYNNYDGFANLGVPTMSNEIPTTVLEGVDKFIRRYYSSVPHYIHKGYYASQVLDDRYRNCFPV